MRSIASIETTPSAWFAKCPTTKLAMTSPVTRRRSLIPGRLTLQLKRLVFEKFLQPVYPCFPAVPRLLEAAEGRVHVEGAAVDVDLAGADAARDALRMRVVLRPYGAGEAVRRVVRDADGVLFVLVGDDREHRAEDLFLRDRHAVLHSSEDRRPHVVAARRRALRVLGASHEKLGTFLYPLLDVGAHALELLERS